jgi:hypothetical protein
VLPINIKEQMGKSKGKGSQEREGGKERLKGWGGKDGQERLGRKGWAGKDGQERMGGKGWAGKDGQERMGGKGWAGKDRRERMGGKRYRQQPVISRTSLIVTNGLWIL